MVIWRWAKENGIDAGVPIDKIGVMINDQFFGGRARPEWITDILSGRKTPFKQLSADAWRKAYNRQTIVTQAKELSQMQQLGPAGKFIKTLREFPRTVAVMGHFGVFPFSHAGDLIFRPLSWGIFFKGLLNTYQGAFSKAHAAETLNYMQSDELYPLALQGGLDASPSSHPSGILTKFLSSEMSERAWKMLTVTRFELWKSQMRKWAKPGMDPKEMLDVAKNLATWANNATGSGKGPIAQYGKDVLFGPKLTQSKLNRLTVDPYNTAKTFANWKNASVGEKAVAWTRVQGAAQYLLSYVGFLAANQGILLAFGSKQKINYTDPHKGDFLMFKGLGLEGNIPGLHTEIRTLANIMATRFASRKDLHGDSRRTATGKIVSGYLMNKSEPGVEMGEELLMRQNWRGQPLPWSDEKGTKKNPKLDWIQYGASHLPIPLEGPIGYVYEHLKQNGASSKDAMSITKGLIITGLGATGVHVQEEKGN
jgi:hypothetical protein